MLIQLNIKFNTDLIQILRQKGTHYVAKYIFILQIQQSLTISQLMQFLQIKYQQLNNFNNKIKYQIIPTNIHLVISERYNKIALGGTFDYIHSGHLLLLTYSSLLLHKEGEIIVGITSQILLKNKKNKALLQSFEKRCDQVKNFLQKFNIKPRLTCLTDGYGPTIIQQDMQALVVTKQTISGGEMINKIRQQKKMKKLQVYVMELIEQKGKNQKISSSLIREQLKIKNELDEQHFIKYRMYWQTLYQRLMLFYSIQFTQDLKKYMKIWYEFILEKYSEHWRYYHTNNHIYNLLSKKTKLEDNQEDISLEYAIWFHDLVYLPNRNDNQQVSRQEFSRFIQGIEKLVNNTLIKIKQKVENAILSTKNHIAHSDLQKILIDLDMGILNSNLETYKIYANNIRLEYEPLFATKSEFNTKRSDFLQKLQNKQIFYYIQDTNNMSQNIKWELSIL